MTWHLNKTPFLWFDPQNEAAYQAWRQWKVAAYPADFSDLIVPIGDASQLVLAEQQALQQRLDQYNMAIYACGPNALADKTIPLGIGKAFGLQRVDANLGAGTGGVTEIEAKDSNLHKRYIPYSRKPLSWHVDGYYNPPERRIRGMMLHCVRPAASGGHSSLLDIEMAYIYIRDQAPGALAVLFESDCLTIPENIVDGELIRPAETGPVFSFDDRGYLHMRYSARQRNIEWKSGADVALARVMLTTLMAGDTTETAPWLIQGTFSAGQGVICNNVLHNRSRFEDTQVAGAATEQKNKALSRLLYRVRYLDRVPTKAQVALDDGSDAG